MISKMTARWAEGEGLNFESVLSLTNNNSLAF